MEKGKELAKLKSSFENLQLRPARRTPAVCRLPLEKAKPRSLVGLCLGVLGRHLEDIADELGEIAESFPADIKMAMVAIARRRKLLNDDVLITLIENSWESLDISGSDVTDIGLQKVVEICSRLQAVDISRCPRITEVGVSKLLEQCSSLEILRWGGCVKSDFTARSCISMLMPKLKDVEGDSWEELDSLYMADGAHSLRWLIWPHIDDCSWQTLATECPRIILNPKPSPFGVRGVQVPVQALPDRALDEGFVENIDPKTWIDRRVSQPSRDLVKTTDSAPASNELPMAERFRLAFVERDARLAPKRAKNARQHKRRAEKELMTSSTNAKSIFLASRVSKVFHY